ncbi:MAG TPA: CHAT domain-containing protein [Phaeodactylibacter sp.]|nr:CHAT domain-containing protein [Phaeodactylibacter sp.]
MKPPTFQLKIYGKEIPQVNEKANEELLIHANHQLAQTIQISATRSSLDHAIVAELAPEDLVEFEFDDGTIWITPSEEIPTIFQLSNRSSERTLTIPQGLNIPTQNRGIFQKTFLLFVKIFKPQKIVAEVSAQLIAAKIESTILENEGLNHVDLDFKFTPFDNNNDTISINTKRPVLLLLHGTSSSTRGSFSEMKSAPMWKDLTQKYGNNILALEHRTWTKNPFENALDVLRALPEDTTLHLLSHSRGGLIGEVLCRCSDRNTLFSKQEIQSLTQLKRKQDAATLRQLNKEAKNKNITVEKFVRVACPAAGTTALTKRIDHFFNIILNLIGYGIGQKANPIFIGIKSLLLAIAKQREDPKILPGLESMIPNSPLQNILNNHLINIKSDLSIIAGNAGWGNVKKTLQTILSRFFYRVDNDFVVDTDSMYMGVVRDNLIYYKFVEGKTIDHFSYFKNQNTQQYIYNALSTPPLAAADGFKEVHRGEKNRNISTVLAGGSVETQPISGTRPIVILVPGIMGSNLYEADDEIWIDYIQMATGSLSRLQISNTEITAKSAVGTAYQNFVNDLEKKYDVFVFPYDWRKSLAESGSILAQKINDSLLSYHQPLQIVAHSMGGLVVRDLMVNHSDFWKKLNALPNFRCVLLGTPWQGSYGIAEVLLGMSSKIKSISRLAIFQSRKTLLTIFRRYQGLLQMLPIHENSHDFFDINLWKKLQFVTDETLWAMPLQKDLNAVANYLQRIKNFKNWEMHNVFYIAGKSDKTASNFVLRDQNGATVNAITPAEIEKTITTKGLFTFKKYELVFSGTSLGDGSVTWASGIPQPLEKNQVFYMDTTHGELANTPKYFSAIKDILEVGTTTELKHFPPISRAMQEVVFIKNSEIVSNDKNILVKNILGLTTQPPFETQTEIPQKPLEITVKNGHLRYAKYPIITGHFKGDGIVSAEKVINDLLDKKLSERAAMGLYPGDIGTNLIHLADDFHDTGVVLVGLGSVEELTPFLLSNTIELGCLEYLMMMGELKGKTKNDYVCISSLLVGSRYANLSLSNSINAILEGVVNANKKIEKLNINLPTISKIEFIELYKSKAEDAFYQLHEICASNHFHQIKLNYPMLKIDGARTYVPLDDEKEWWKRITALVKKDTHNQQQYLSFSASTGRALVEVRKSFANLQVINALLEDNKTHTIWDKELTKTVFELLIPNDFKISFRNQQNILLILDKTTASFPWELLNYDKNINLPIVVSAGMIRQLSTIHGRQKIKSVNQKTALIIGDPLLDKTAGIPQLPAAAAEAQLVNTLLEQNNFETTPRINESFLEIFKKLYDEYKVIHVASHGVIDYGKDKKTGILLSNNIVLTAAEINQISSTPELVFVNSCYMGAIHPEKEAYFHRKHQLAANIGVEFIENGVKAVIVAGWAVNDAAAKRFAKVFYEKMLDGEMFSEAVKAARSVCFNDFPNTNTWGAYQCYGDPFYQLTKKRRKRGDENPYILEREILIDLEKFIDNTKSSRKRDYKFLEQLHRISQRIDSSNLRNAKITELEIRAYSELEEYDVALEKYKHLFEEKDATFQVRSLELWSSYKIKALTEFKNKINDDLLNENIDAAISKMEGLLDWGKTSERYNILASVYKRQFMISKKNQTKTTLKKSADCYQKGYLLHPEIYSLTSWVIAEKIINNEQRIKKLNETLGHDVHTFILDKIEEYQKNITDKNEFWDLIQSVNLLETQLLFCIGKQHDKKRKSIVSQIKNAYTKAWNQGGGSARHKKSEVEQMEFIRVALEFVEKQKPKKKRRNLNATFEALDELILFFDKIK